VPGTPLFVNGFKIFFMANFTFFSAVLDSNTEHEFKSRQGFQVLVLDCDDNATRYNGVTEIHFRHDGKEAVALESDIHCTGVNLQLSGIRQVVCNEISVIKADTFDKVIA